MSVHVLRTALLAAMFLPVARGGPETPCDGCVVCEHDYPSAANPRWTHVFWYDPDDRQLKLTVYANWVPTWYTYAVPDPNCAALAESCTPPPAEPNDPFDFHDDCDADGLPDWCQILRDPTHADGDCDGNLRLDICEIADAPDRDACNRNGIPDDCEPDTDCNDNGIRDICEIADCSGDPDCSDCDLDNRPDGCQLDPTSDCNGNDLLDRCEIDADPNRDCNLDGQLDACADGDCVPPAFQPATPPAPDADCDLLVWATHCSPVQFALEDPNAGCTLVEQGGGPPDWYFARLRGCRTGQVVTVRATALDCVATQSIPIDWPDCDQNRRDDQCELAAASAEDCDENGIPDACDPIACGFRGQIEAVGPDALGRYELRIAHCGPVTWELLDNIAGCPDPLPLAPDGVLQRARLAACVTTDTVRVRVTSVADPDCQRETRLEMTCDTCSTCADGGVELGSVRARFPLGSAADGRSLGELVLASETPDADLATARALRLPRRHPRVWVTRAPDGSLQQVRTPHEVFQVASLPEGGFAIEVFPRDQIVGGQPAAGADPLRSWSVTQLPETDFALRITFQRAGQIQRSHTARAAWGSRDWTLQTRAADGRLVRRSSVTWTGLRRDQRTWQDGGLARVTRTIFDTSGTRPLTIIEDPNGIASTTEQRFDSTGRIISRHEPDGGWRFYAYDQHGRLVRETRGWLDAALAPGDDPNAVDGHTWRYTYAEPYDPNATRPSADEPIRIDESIAGRPVRRWTLQHVNVATEPNLPPAPGLAITVCDPNDAEPCQRTTLLFDADEPNRIAGVESGGGNFTAIARQVAQLQFDQDRPLLVAGSAQGDSVTVVTHLPSRSAAPLAGWTTRTRTLRPASRPGWQYAEQQAFLPEAGTADGYVTLRWQLAWIDLHGRVTAVRDSDGVERTIDWQDCCAARTIHDPLGPDLSVRLDDLGRLRRLQRDAVPDLPGLVQQITRTRSGPLLDLLVTQTADDGATRTTTRRYDRLGRLVSESDALGRCTRWQYDLTPAGGRRVTRIDPSGTHETHSFYRDGRPRRLTGPGVTGRAWSWRVTPAGRIREIEHIGPRAARRWLVHVVDAFTRSRQVLQPTFGNTAEPNDPAAATVLRRTYSYDSQPADTFDDGRLVRVRIDQAGIPQRADLLLEYDPTTGDPLRSGLDLNGDGALASAPGEVARHTRARFLWDGLRAWHRQADTLQRYNAADIDIGEVRTSDALGDAPRAVLTSERTGNVRLGTVQTDAAGRRVTTVTFGRRDARDRVMPVASAARITRADILLATRDPHGAETTWTRNAFGEAIAVDGPAGSFSATYGPDGRVATATDAAGRQTRYDYHPDTGLLQTVTDPAGRQRFFTWTPGRQLRRVWGAGVHPTQRDYDPFGALEAVHTFRQSADWFAPVWPSVSGDVRRWLRDPSTGLVAGVVDGLGTLTRLDHDALGRMRTRYRPGEPNTPAVQYAYDDPAGRLTSVTHADGTPDVTLAYHDFGQLAELTDAAGRRTFRYDDHLQLRSIRFAADSLFPDRTIRLRTSTLPHVRLPAAPTPGVTPLWNRTERTVRVRDAVAGTDEYDARYQLELPTGRPTHLRFGDQPDIAFRYHDNGLPAETSGPGFSIETTAQAGTSQLTGITLTRTGGPATAFRYQHDPLGRPTSLQVIGEAAIGPHGDLEQWTYNDRDELIAERHFRLDPLVDPGLPAANGTHTYGYDPAGNRLWTDDPNHPDAFNAANQLLAGPHGDACEYDAAGNLRRDADWEYTWNAAGRLVALDPQQVVVDAVRLRYRYDARGRRIEESRERFDGSAWQCVAQRRWLWLGWRPLVVYEAAADGVFHVKQRLAWGPDSRGRFDNVPAGGLLAVSTDATTEWVIADGTARPRLLLNAETGATRRLANEAFGLPLETPPLDFPWRGPGQQYDDATGLTWNGARYHRPRWGRWLQPDPLDVAGGSNLYRQVDNRPTERVDPLGLCGVDLRSLASESPAFAARAGLPPLVRLDQPTLRLPRLSYAGVSAVGGAVTTAVGGQLPRIGGVAGVVGGTAEAVLGLVLVQCSGGAALPVGAVMVGHGVDTLQAGGRSAWHNRPVDTVTFQIGHNIGQRVGGDLGGFLGGFALDLGTGLGGSLLSGRLLRLGRITAPGAAAADCCCCELQFLRADDGLGLPTGVLSAGGLDDARLNVVLNETNELRIRIGDRILELDFEPIRQHDGTLHLMDLDVLDSVGGPNTLGNSVLLSLFEQLRREARALGYQRLRISGYRTTGASPGRPVDRCWDLD